MVLDRPQKENQVFYFLYSLNHAGEDVPINEDFMMKICFLFLLKHLGSQILPITLLQESCLLIFHLIRKKRIIRKSFDYSWIMGDLLFTGPNLIIRRCV